MHKIYKGALFVLAGFICTVILTILLLAVPYFTGQYADRTPLLTVMYALTAIPYLIGGIILFDFYYDYRAYNPNVKIGMLICGAIALLIHYIRKALPERSFFDPMLLVILLIALSLLVKAIIEMIKEYTSEQNMNKK
jgi:ABC-type Fe3+-siderophore transport system permease subunit